MEITENGLYEAFGLTPPAQEPAAPAADPSPTPSAEGAQAQEPADPAAEEEQVQEPAESREPASDGQETGADTTGSAKPVQTEQERRENAARRRREEQQAAVDAAVQQALKAERERSKAQMDAFFAKARLKNTITGEPITTMEQFNAWSTAYDAEQLQRDLAAGKLTPEGLEKAIANSPAVKRAMEIVEREEQTAARQQETAAQEKIRADLLEIQKHDPSIREVKDFLKMPNFPQFKAYVDRGYTYADAYYLVNRADMEAAAARAAREQAALNARSKEHLTPAAQRGSGAASVPAEQMKLYRMLMPNATEAEIQAHYNKQKR